MIQPNVEFKDVNHYDVFDSIPDVESNSIGSRDVKRNWFIKFQGFEIFC